VKKDSLHNHPGTEKILKESTELSEDFLKIHVIVDKEDWLKAKQLIRDFTVSIKNFSDNTYKVNSPEGYSTPPVNKLDPSLRPNQGIKYDSGKPRFDLIPADALEEVAKVYSVGANKYGDRNWEKGLSYGRLFGAMMRHAWTWWKGEKNDESNKFKGTSVNHLASVVFCALGLLHYDLNSGKFSKMDERKNK